MTSGDLAVGVIGLGFGANHARVLSELEGVRLAAVCDLDPDRLSAVATQHDAAPYGDFEKMLWKERLDAVVVAVPALLHEPVALAAIKAGCAVLVEKPLSPTLAGGRRVAEAAAAAGVPLMPGHIERFNPAIQELARRVRAGEAGRLLQINARRLAYFVERGRTIDVGVVEDLALHDIDILRYLAGAEVERVYAEAHSRVRTQFDDGIVAVLRFESAGGAPGIVAQLEVNRLSARMVRDTTVLGERGLLVAEYADFRSASVEFQPAQDLRGTQAGPVEGAPVRLGGTAPASPLRLAVEPREPLVEELTAFVRALRESKPMPVTADDGLRALAIADAISESAHTGRPVTPEAV